MVACWSTLLSGLFGKYRQPLWQLLLRFTPSLLNIIRQTFCVSLVAVLASSKCDAARSKTVGSQYGAVSFISDRL